MTRDEILRLAAVCQRLAETQQNLSVPMTVEERLDLRAAAKALRESAKA